MATRPCRRVEIHFACPAYCRGLSNYQYYGSIFPNISYNIIHLGIDDPTMLVMIKAPYGTQSHAEDISCCRLKVLKTGVEAQPGASMPHEPCSKLLITGIYRDYIGSLVEGY